MQASVDVIKKEIDANLAATQQELAAQKTAGLEEIHPDGGGGGGGGGAADGSSGDDVTPVDKKGEPEAAGGAIRRPG